MCNIAKSDFSVDKLACLWLNAYYINGIDGKFAPFEPFRESAFGASRWERFGQSDSRVGFVNPQAVMKHGRPVIGFGLVGVRE